MFIGREVAPLGAVYRKMWNWCGKWIHARFLFLLTVHVKFSREKKLLKYIMQQFQIKILYHHSNHMLNLVLGTYIPMQWVTKWSILPRLCQASSTWRDCNQQPVAWTRTYSYIRYLVIYCTYYMSQASEPGVAKLEITIIIIFFFFARKDSW